MKSAMILAALCAALCASAPATVQAATTLTDHDLYCSVIPLTTKCNPPKPAAAPAKAAPMKVAAAKPVAKPAAPVGMKTASCVPAPAGSAFLYSCTWK